MLIRARHWFRGFVYWSICLLNSASLPADVGESQLMWSATRGHCSAQPAGFFSAQDIVLVLLIIYSRSFVTLSKLNSPHLTPNPVTLPEALTKEPRSINPFTTDVSASPFIQHLGNTWLFKPAWLYYASITPIQLPPYFSLGFVQISAFLVWVNVLVLTWLWGLNSFSFWWLI